MQDLEIKYSDETSIGLYSSYAFLTSNSVIIYLERIWVILVQDSLVSFHCNKLYIAANVSTAMFMDSLQTFLNVTLTTNGMDTRIGHNEDINLHDLLIFSEREIHLKDNTVCGMSLGTLHREHLIFHWRELPRLSVLELPNSLASDPFFPLDNLVTPTANAKHNSCGSNTIHLFSTLWQLQKFWFFGTGRFSYNDNAALILFAKVLPPRSENRRLLKSCRSNCGLSREIWQ